MKHVLMATALALSAVPATAQEVSSWSELLSPRQLLGGLVQYGVLAARTQVDFTYSGLSVDPIESRATLYDVKMWPALWWDQNNDCHINIDRISLKGSTLSDIVNFRAKIEIVGLELNPACIPPEARTAQRVIRLEALSAPRTTVDLRYHLPSGNADVLIASVVEDLGAVTIEAEFDYLSIGPSNAYSRDPVPVAFLSFARLNFENDGLWERVMPLIPPAFIDPESGPSRVSTIMRSQRDEVIGVTPRQAVSDGYDAFVNTAEKTMIKFLLDPSRVVLETAFDPEMSVYLDFEAYERNPEQLFEDLQPIFSVQPRLVKDLIPREFVVMAAQGTSAALDDDDRRALGLALLTGEGAPRSRELGLSVLSDLPRQGDGHVAFEIARAFAVDSPERAYPFALEASREGTVGAMALLDDIEPRIAPRTIFKLQEGLNAMSPDLPAGIGEMREVAARYFDGREGRSYVLASYWARLAAAAGDTASLRLLEDIEDRMQSLDAAAEWQQQEVLVAERAVRDWGTLDFPSLTRLPD